MATSAAHAHGGIRARSSAWRHLAWSGVALQAAALVAIFFVERWHGLPSMLIYLAVTVAFLWADESIPNLLSFLVVLAAVLNAFGWAFNLFEMIGFYDELIHLFSSFAVIGALGCHAWTHNHVDAQPGSWRFVGILAGFGLGLGILWELVEMTFLDLTWGDTLADLVIDTVGAACAAPLVSWTIRDTGAGSLAARL